jgi:hypothetical protein
VAMPKEGNKDCCGFALHDFVQKRMYITSKRTPA